MAPVFTATTTTTTHMSRVRVMVGAIVDGMDTRISEERGTITMTYHHL